jgi:hypothetical protein
MNARPPFARAPQAVSRWWLRVLLPSWRFFEAEDARYSLEARILREGEAPSPFLPAVPSVRRAALACLFSPEHNLRLFCHDLIERWVLELAERGPIAEHEVEALASYAPVRTLAGYFVREEHGAPNRAHYQLRLLAHDADDSVEARAPEREQNQEVLFLSPSYPVSR